MKIFGNVCFIMTYVLARVWPLSRVCAVHIEFSLERWLGLVHFL